MAGRGLAPLAALAAELGDLKRVRDARGPESIATRLFIQAWRAVVAGTPIPAVAETVTADALAAIRLGAIDMAMMRRIGMGGPAGRAVLSSSLDAVAAPLAPGMVARLTRAVGVPLPQAATPEFVVALARQPRAGATSPGKPRILLEPPESHADHCLVVAVLGCLFAGRYGGDPATVFLAGLIHHAHNAVLPDSGFAGEVMLGEHLAPIMHRLFAEAYATLPQGPAELARLAMVHAASADTPEGRAFNAADVVDRVLQQRHYADVAGFTLDKAIGDLELVHAGPLQAFQNDVLAEAGLA